MVSKPRLWWQKIKQHWVAIGVVVIILLTVTALIFIGYLFNWTGFNGYTQISTVRVVNTSSGTVTRTEVLQPRKTLWDWLQLLAALAIPVVVGVGVAWFTTKFNEQQSRTEHEIASDNQQEAALQTYIDQISELLLHEKLRESKSEDEVRTIARVQTLIVLPRLDNVRKRSVLQFLHESSLIIKDKHIVDLDGTDLHEANLFRINLNGVTLSKSNLTKANLGRADLREADLHDANLSGANLWGAKLSGANLSRTDLSRADLSQANLPKANLSEADLSGANLSRANLSEANLSRANLSGAKLSEANLSGANLGGTDLRGADLEDAILSQANLWEAKVTQRRLALAKLLQGAVMPDGSTHI